MTAQAISSEIRSMMSGPLDWMLPLLADSDDPRPSLRCDRLLEPATLAAVLHRYALQHPDAPMRAVASIWSQGYFASLCLPLIFCALVQGRAVSAPLNQTEIVFDAEGRAVAVRPMGAFHDNPAQFDTPLDPLMSEHLMPLVAAIAAEARVSARVLWGNAAHYIEWLIGWLDEQGRFSAELAAAAYRFLSRSHLPDGTTNPFKDAIHYAGHCAGNSTETAASKMPDLRRRKVCCLRYAVDGVPNCGNLCPSPEVRRGLLS